MLLPQVVIERADSNARQDEEEGDLGQGLGLVVVDANGTAHSGVGALVAMLHASPLFFSFANPLCATLWQRVMPTCGTIVSDKNGTSSCTGEGFVSMHPQRTTRRKLFKRLLWLCLHLFVVWTLYLVVLWNNTNADREPKISRTESTVLLALNLDQYWGMFSPRPPDTWFYYAMLGTLDSGEKVELWRDQQRLTRWELREASSAPPKSLVESIGNHRWFKLYETVNSENSDPLRLALGRYICREWNRRHGGEERLATYEIHLIQVLIQLPWDNEPPQPQFDNVIWTHTC
jgi:hypothetical protein